MSPSVLRASFPVWLAGLSLTPLAFPQQVILPLQEALPGSVLVLPAVFRPAPNPVTAVQFDVRYDSSSINFTATVGEAARASGKRIYSVDLAPDTRRFLIAGFNQTPLPGGSLINLFVSVRQDAVAGPRTLFLSNVVAADPNGIVAPVDGSDGMINIRNSGGLGSRLQLDGVLNSASLLPGPVAPGEIVIVLGTDIGPPEAQSPTLTPSSTVLGGVSLIFDQDPSPLLYVAANRIHAVVPYSVAQKASSRLRVMRAGEVVAELSLPVVPTSPALYSLDSSGVGPGAILNQDSTVNSPSNPAARGTVLVLFATGAGRTEPAGVDGLVAEGIFPTPLAPVAVQIGGVDAEVLYAGSAPGLIAGVLQVNCLLPPGVPSGYAVPVVLKIGDASSQPGISVAIQ